MMGLKVIYLVYWHPAMGTGKNKINDPIMISAFAINGKTQKQNVSTIKLEQELGP